MRHAIILLREGFLVGLKHKTTLLHAARSIAMTLDFRHKFLFERLRRVKNQNELSDSNLKSFYIFTCSCTLSYFVIYPSHQIPLLLSRISISIFTKTFGFLFFHLFRNFGELDAFTFQFQLRIRKFEFSNEI